MGKLYRDRETKRQDRQTYRETVRQTDRPTDRHLTYRKGQNRLSDGHRDTELCNMYIYLSDGCVGVAKEEAGHLVVLGVGITVIRH